MAQDASISLNGFASMRHALMKLPAASVRALAALVLIGGLVLPQAAGAQGGLFDFLTGGESPRRAAPPEPAAAASSTETKKKKPAAGRETTTEKATQRESKPGDAAANAAPPADAPPPPYEAQLLRLSEVIGGLTFLRDLCAAGDGDEWRGKMTALLDAEAPSGPRRDKYVAAFNRGFRGYEHTYRACTPNARFAISRYLGEAGRISRDISYRYGGA
jgi:uncharacterized protein (TIGR02301 family)